jgi:hypothetical protein
MNPLEAANPIAVTKRVVGLAGTAVGLAGTAAREAVHAPVGVTRGAIHVAGAAAGLAGTVARETAHALRADRGDEHLAHRQAADVDRAGPTIVAAEPRAPEGPPVDVVGDALAAEAAAERGHGPEGAGMAHEPRAGSRDEEHGDAALQRAEVDEIAAEVSAALEGDVDPGEHLTQPLLDSADTKAAAAELATMSKAADPDKG